MDQSTDTSRVHRSVAARRGSAAAGDRPGGGAAELLAELINELFQASSPTRSEASQRPLQMLTMTSAAWEWFAQTGQLPSPDDWSDSSEWPDPERAGDLFGSWEAMLATAGLTAGSQLPLVTGLAPRLIALRDRLATDARNARRSEERIGAERRQEQEELQRRLQRAEREVSERTAEADERVASAEAARARAEERSSELAQQLADQQARVMQLQRLVQEAEAAARQATERSLSLAARVNSEFVHAPPAFRAWIELAATPLSARLEAIAAALPSASLRAEIVAATAGLSEHFDGEYLMTVRRHEAADAALVELCLTKALATAPGALQTLTVILWHHGARGGALTEIRASGADAEIDEARLRELAHAYTQAAEPHADAGWSLQTAARTVCREDFDRFAKFLCDPRRLRPALVLTNQIERPPADDPNELAGALCGAAHVIVLNRGGAGLMTEHFGEGLSVWNGAVRCYQAGFGPDACGDQHPYLTRATLSDLDPHETREQLMLLCSPVQAVPARLLAAGAAAGAPMAAIPCLREAASEPVASHDREPFGGRIATLTRERDQAVEARVRFERVTSALESQAPKTVLEAAERAAGDAEHLRFTRSAFTSAAESPYRRPDAVYASLMLLDQLAGEFEQGELGERLTDRAAALGLDYRSAVSPNARRQEEHYTCTYEGRTLPLGPHLVIGGGGGTVRNLRVYMYRADGEEGLPRGLIVGHIGVHLPSKSGSS